MLVHFRRPVPRDVRDIGRWTNILHSITMIAVYANAFLIALTSDFIPRLVSTAKIIIIDTKKSKMTASIIRFMSMATALMERLMATSTSPCPSSRHRT